MEHIWYMLQTTRARLPICKLEDAGYTTVASLEKRQFKGTDMQPARSSEVLNDALGINFILRYFFVLAT
jgi:hypothetical protein